MYRNTSADRPGIDSTESEELFRLLDGLPLAIAQASAYLRQSEISVAKYIQLYNQQWKSLMESQDRTGAPLRDYPDHNVWTTWTISYDAIRAKSMAAASALGMSRQQGPVVWSSCKSRHEFCSGGVLV